VLTNVQVLAGATSVARYDDVVVWFETGPQGGGTVLTQLLQVVQGVSSGVVTPAQMGARLAAALNTGDASSVPAMVAATPENHGLRVVVHGWGAVVTDGLRVPNGWADQVIADRNTFFLGRNTVAPVAPVEGSTFDLEDGVVPGDGVGFALSPANQPVAGAVGPAPVGPGPGSAPPPSPPPQAGSRADSSPVAGPPGVFPPEGPSGTNPPPGPPAPIIQTAPPSWDQSPSGAPGPPGRLVLDDGSSAVLEQTCVLGSAPHGSPAVQTGVAIPLTVFGPGVAPVHAEIRVEHGQVAVRDLGAAPTYVLAPGMPSWLPLAAGQISPLAPGTRLALGQRTISYERP